MAANTADLERKVRLYERQLAVLEALDRLRDTSLSAEPFLNGCIAVLDSELRPDLCELLLVDEAEHPNVRVLIERWEPEPQELPRALLEQALQTGEQAEASVEGGTLRAWPLEVRREKLGALLVGRRGRSFGQDELGLIALMRAQIDSALKHLRTLEQLRRRQRELETIYHIDRLIDTTQDFETALQEALRLLSETIDAELSFIMLYTPDERELELRAASDHELTDPAKPLGKEIRALARETIAGGQMLHRNGMPGQISSYLGIPLILKDQIIGVFAGANRRKGHSFGPDEVGLLRAIASQMDTALFEDRRQQHIRQTFARYVSPAVVDLMLRTADRDYLKVGRQTLTMLFSDMRGFTSISEQLSADVVGEMLNEHLAAMTEIIREAGGTVDKFVGDEVVAFWGAPLPRQDHALAAVETAIHMQQRQDSLAAAWRERGLPDVAIGIGIGTGEVVVGNIGSPQMMNYTVIGSDVNLAARLCAAADPHQILLNEATYALVREQIQAQPVAPLSLRHISRPVQAYEVLYAD